MDELRHEQQTASAGGVVVLGPDDRQARAFVLDLDDDEVVTLVRKDPDDDVSESHVFVDIGHQFRDHEPADVVVGYPQFPEARHEEAAGQARCLVGRF
ncbi:hypothetical protein [Actinomadura sp. 7K507]|uniref:hypothetical protein n=1 Tax=Actinomadura sp. 7K507 TaxID=2530365 RepID=UPI001FB685E5|nr:hypothetical protein [Actinomadura sp. 7K507]